MVKRSRTYKKSRKHSRKSGRKQRKQGRTYKKEERSPNTPTHKNSIRRNPPPPPLRRRRVQQSLQTQEGLTTSITTTSPGPIVSPKCR